MNLPIPSSNGLMSSKLILDKKEKNLRTFWVENWYVNAKKLFWGMICNIGVGSYLCTRF